MTQPAAGDLVKVSTGGPELDGIVFEAAAGGAKLIVAIVDRERGPVMRSVDADTVAERTEAAPADKALQALIRRTPHTSRGSGRGGSGVGGGQAGHKRAAMHRTTGK
jgi:hypothetical protein